MPRRRTRKTNWRPQEERRLRARGVRRGEPDARKLARAFIGLALAKAEVDAQAQAQAERDAAQPEERLVPAVDLNKQSRTEDGDDRV